MKKGDLSLLLCLVVLCCAMSNGAFAVTDNQTAADGTYIASGDVDFWADFYTFELTLTVKDGTISTISQEFTSTPYEADSEDYYHPRALNSLISKLRGKPATVSAIDEYAADAVTGATYSYNALRSAVRSALESAPESTGGGAVTKYTVSYDLNGAPGETLSPALYAPGESVTVADDPVWENHRFEGWTGISLEDKSFLMPEEDVILTAQWTCQLELRSGQSENVTAGEDSYAATVLFSGSQLKNNTIYKLVYAQYDSSGRMLKCTMSNILFRNGSFTAEVDMGSPGIGHTVKIFLLDATFKPQCSCTSVHFASKIPDGTYAGSAQCLTGYMNYFVDVLVSVKDGLITGIADQTLRIPMSSKDRELYAKAWDALSSEISELQPQADPFEGVDAVSGATLSSSGINSAIQDALETQAAPVETEGDLFAPEGISLYARVYPIVTVADGKITHIRLVPVRTTDTQQLEEFTESIIEKQSVSGLEWPEEIADDAYAVANLVDQILYGKGVLQ